MSLPSTLKGRLAAALAVAVAAPIVQAQTAQQLEERRLQYNEERRREVERSGAPGSSGSDGLYSTPGAPAPSGNSAGDAALAAALERTRRNYEKQPPLPAARNRLLGRWTLDTRRKPTNMLEELAGALGNNCTMLWGTGVWEFRAKQLVNGDSRPPMVIDTEYRGNANAVAVLPKEFFQLLVFEFVGPDRVRETVTASQLATCEFVRVGAPAQFAAAGGQRGDPVTTPGAKPGVAPAPAVAAAPSRPPGADRAGCQGNLSDQLGRARLPEAQRAVLARFPNVQTRTLANGHTQILGNGSRCDDARLRATVYEFDGAGVLQQVVLLWNRPEGPVPSAVFTERAAELARGFDAPAPQTPGVLEAVVSGRRIVLKDLPPQGLTAEAHGVAR